MNLFSQKRGKVTFEQVSLVLELLAAAIVLIALIFFVKDTAEDTLFEKNYLARDIALVTTTVYASPGDLVYVYDFGEYAGKFDVTFKGSIVTVSDVRGRVQYWFGKDENLGSAPVKIKKAEAVAFVKTPKELKIGGYGGSVESLAIRAVTEEEKKELEEETRKLPTPESTPLPTEFYLCENKCTAKKGDCSTEIKAFKTFEECQKEVKIEGRIIFVPVNWKPDNLKAIVSENLEVYKNLYGDKKTDVYLSKVDCNINLESSKVDVFSELRKCAEEDENGLGKGQLKGDDIIIGVVEKLKDGVAGFTQRKNTGGAGHKSIFLSSISESFTLSHEAGHLERNYCEEYDYEGVASIVEKPEDVTFSALGARTFTEAVTIFVEVMKEAYIKDGAINQDEKFQIEYKDPDTATVFFKTKDNFVVGIEFKNKNNERIIYTIVIARILSSGWSPENEEAKCPNPYPKCCKDNPDYSLASDDVKNYGINCHPENKDFQENEIIELCVGGPCSSSAGLNDCRSIMGGARIEGITTRGLPVEK